MKKKTKVLEILTKYPELTLYQVAERGGCTHEYARQLRKKLNAATMPEVQEAPKQPELWGMCKHGYRNNEYCPACDEEEKSLEPTPEMLEAVLEAEAILTPEAIGGIDTILNERGSRYGSFITHAYITQRIKAVMSDTPNWVVLDDDMVEALEMIAHKVGRILNGDPTYADSWVDIAGYAQLVVNRLQGKEG